MSTSFLMILIAATAWVSDTAPQAPVALDELFVTQGRHRDNLDSIAVYAGKTRAYAIVTAKSSHRLLVYDAGDGRLVSEIGGEGTDPGRFRRPNGILAVDDLLMVVERDNHRVQVLSLPDLKFVAFIGADVLIKPYGLTAYPAKDGLRLLVTDDYAAEGELPADFYTRRVKQFRITRTNDGLTSELLGTIGDASGPGRLFKVESILADPAYDRLYICDEQGDSVGVKIYDLAGRFTGKRLDSVHFGGEPEGVALYPTGPDSGYLVVTDQQPTVSLFHVLDRKTLAYQATFRGHKTANTDGITISAAPSPGLPAGGLWAVHDDQALACFNWQELAAHLKAD